MTHVRLCTLRRFGETRGAALIDIIVSISVCVLMASIAVPVIGGTLERERTIIGAEYLAGQLQRARLDSLKRARSVAVRLQVIGDRTEMRLFVDANGNGVRQSDIDHGIDLPLSPAEWLDDQARDVSLRINQEITDVAGSSNLSPGDDPLRIGHTSILAFSPLGSATGGTLYVAAHRGPQMAIRVFGATGRVRVLMFDARTAQWQP
jgi:Tfp pilus assembly protein FimT